MPVPVGVCVRVGGEAVAVCVAVGARDSVVVGDGGETERDGDEAVGEVEPVAVGERVLRVPERETEAEERVKVPGVGVAVGETVTEYVQEKRSVGTCVRVPVGVPVQDAVLGDREAVPEERVGEPLPGVGVWVWVTEGVEDCVAYSLGTSVWVPVGVRERVEEGERVGTRERERVAVGVGLGDGRGEKLRLGLGVGDPGVRVGEGGVRVGVAVLESVGDHSGDEVGDRVRVNVYVSEARVREHVRRLDVLQLIVRLRRVGVRDVYEGVSERLAERASDRVGDPVLEVVAVVVAHAVGVPDAVGSVAEGVRLVPVKLRDAGLPEGVRLRVERERVWEPVGSLGVHVGDGGVGVGVREAGLGVGVHVGGDGVGVAEVWVRDWGVSVRSAVGVAGETLGLMLVPVAEAEAVVDRERRRVSVGLQVWLGLSRESVREEAVRVPLGVGVGAVERDPVPVGVGVLLGEGVARLGENVRVRL